MADEQLCGQVVQINVNPQGGVPKYRVAAAEISVGGVAGDKQRDSEHHGGPERAVCLFSYERIEALRAEGHSIQPGSTGENLTVRGIDWDALVVGDCLQIGERVVIEITGYTAPCEKIADSFKGGTFKRVSQKVYPGWSRLYARVLIEGEVREGDPIVYVIGAA